MTRHRFSVGELVQVEGAGSGVDSGDLGRVIKPINWQKVPGLYKRPGTDEVFIRLNGWRQPFGADHWTYYEHLDGQIITMFKDRLFTGNRIGSGIPLPEGI